MPDGQLRLLFVRDGARVGLVQRASESANNADQFLARYLVDMINDVAAPGVVVAVSRHDGRATHSDRQLWSMLGELLAPTTTTLLDVVAIGSKRVWSVRRARPLNAPRRARAGQHRAGRRSASRAAAR